MLPYRKRKTRVRLKSEYQMLCYKDMTFCAADDCSNLNCLRNTKRADFQPDGFFKDKIAYSDFQKECLDYWEKREKRKRKKGH